VIAGAWHIARLLKTLEALSTGLVVPGVRATLPFSIPVHKYGVGTRRVHASPNSAVPNVGAPLAAPSAGRASPAPTKPLRRHHSGPVRIRDLIHETHYLEPIVLPFRKIEVGA
jgi:hypothetical protein